MTRSIWLVLFIGACASNDIPRVEACQEQADAWCEVVAVGPGCTAAYLRWCGEGSPVDAVAQASCLGAMDERWPAWDEALYPAASWEGSYPPPNECQRTWSAPCFSFSCT
jgi:hypothetical protein